MKALKGLSLNRLSIIGIYIYIFAPTILFLLFWLKPVYAMIVGALTLFGMSESIAEEKPFWAPRWNRDNVIKVTVVFFLIILWVLYSGIGASVVQYTDHLYRNLMYRLLVDYDWPAYHMHGDSKRAFVYYFGYWLPAALLAKLTHSYSFGFLFQQIWAVIGMFFVWYCVCEKQKKLRLWYLIVLVFFGGLDAVGRYLSMDFFTTVGNRFEWWSVAFNYPSFSVQLFWTFNQFIYSLVIFCLLERQKNNKGLVLIWSTALITCTITAVGMIPFVVYKAIQNAKGEKKLIRFKNAVLSSISIANIAGVIVSLVLTLFLLPNEAVVDNAGSLTTGAHANFASIAHDVPNPEDTFRAYMITTKIWMFMLFVLLEFGVYYMLIYKSEGRKPIYWISFVVLLICPWIRVGYMTDFGIKANIPALFILMQMIISAIHKYRKEKRFVILPVLILMLMIGSLSTVDAMRGTMLDTSQKIYNGELVWPRTAWDIDEPSVFINESMSSGTNTFFFKYLARK